MTATPRQATAHSGAAASEQFLREFNGVLVVLAGLSLLLLTLSERRGTTGCSPEGVDTTEDHADIITRQKGRS